MVQETSVRSLNAAEFVGGSKEFPGVSLPGLGISASPVGLSFGSDITLHAWCRLGIHVSMLGTASAWWIGDWLVYGQDRYKDRYRRSMSEYCLDYQTLRNYAWVARRVELPRRRRSLSFQHHAEIARLPGEQQSRWLAMAEEHAWSRNTLRRHLRGFPEAKRRLTTSVRLDVPPEHRHRWEQAADAAGMSLTAWVISCLETAIPD
ncbi:LmbU family transcriptional regulator [Amycolatopsis aidingensis]|uniref:LmbU family transcriptional regulator n=1 Tax=Amycolatopsis aidingensis TaxID=2842453 RepID=UPI001C0E22CA|nr:LmbU family transcriptional regulator [Amycolatopsis aidingensis]